MPPARTKENPEEQKKIHAARRSRVLKDTLSQLADGVASLRIGEVDEINEPLIANQLLANTTVRELEIFDTVGPIRSALCKREAPLVKLRFEHCTMSSDELTQLFTELPSLTWLDLTKCRPPGFNTAHSSLCSLIASNTNLRVLDLTGAIAVEQFDELFIALKRNSTLRSLSLADPFHVTYQFGRNTLQSLLGVRSLQYLNLHDHSLSVEDSETIACYLVAEDSHLANLTITFASYDDEDSPKSLAKIASAISRGNSSLTSLTDDAPAHGAIEANMIFATLLQTNTTLVHLQAGCAIDDSSAPSWAAALRLNTTLTYLKLNGAVDSGLGASGAAAVLADALAHNRSLLSINMDSSIPLCKDSLATGAVNNMIRRNATLVQLNGFQHFETDALHHNHTIVEWKCNYFASQGYIEPLIKFNAQLQRLHRCAFIRSFLYLCLARLRSQQDQYYLVSLLNLPADIWNKLLFDHLCVEWRSLLGVTLSRVRSCARWIQSNVSSLLETLQKLRGLPAVTRFALMECVHPMSPGRIRIEIRKDFLLPDEGETTTV